MQSWFRCWWGASNWHDWLKPHERFIECCCNRESAWQQHRPYFQLFFLLLFAGRNREERIAENEGTSCGWGAKPVDGSMCDGGGVLADICYNEGEVSDRQEARTGTPTCRMCRGASWESAHLASIGENKIWQSCFTQYALVLCYLSGMWWLAARI